MSNAISGKGCLQDRQKQRSLTAVLKTELSRIIFSSLFWVTLTLALNLSATMVTDQTKENTPTVKLTHEEQAWLKAHPTITLGGGQFPPLDSRSLKTERPEGIGPDYTDLIGRMLGIRFNYVSGEWADVLEKVKTKKIDGIRLILKNSERAQYLGFTKAYTTVRYAVFTQKQSSDRLNLSDLSHRRVGVMRATYSENYLKENRPEIEVVGYASVDDALLALVSGDLEAVVASLAVAGVAINRLFITNLKVTALAQGMGNELHVGVRKDWPRFVTILNKAIDAIPPAHHRKIRRKWVALHPESEIEKRVTLTDAERIWLAQDRVARIRVTNVPPYLSVKDGKPIGIAADLIKAVSDRTGIKYRFENPSPPFSVDLKGIINHTGPDLIASLMPTPERTKSILFTETYISSPRFIFTRDDAQFVASIANLAGKTVSVVRDYVVHKNLAENYPNINLWPCKNSETALKAVSSGRAFAFIGDLISTPIMINEFGLKNLKAVAPSGLPDHAQAMGIRSDWPELRDILDKGLKAIPEEERTAIINKWSTVKIDYGIRPVDFLKWILIVTATASGILFLFVFWNRSLTKKVHARTRALENTAESLAAEINERSIAESALRESRDYMKNLTDSMADAVFSVKLPERIIEWANDSFNVLGYDKSEYIGKTTEFLYASEGDYLAFGDEINRATATGQRIMRTERFLRKKNGDLFPADITVTFFMQKERLSRITGIVRDISERKTREKQLQAYQIRLKALASQLTIAEEKERRRIAVDLHDHVGQSLALARMQIAAARKRVTDATTAAKFDEISNTLYEALQETRHLMFDLSSPAMNELGLAAAIEEWLETQIENRHGLETEFIAALDPSHRNMLKESTRALLFRNVRELLTNVIKHARANTVSVHLKSENTRVTIIIQDDGIGFDPQTATQSENPIGGFGLFSIQERINDLGGKLEISSSPGKGCRVTMTAPVQ